MTGMDLLTVDRAGRCRRVGLRLTLGSSRKPPELLPRRASGRRAEEQL